jgi:hypothetical protein
MNVGLENALTTRVENDGPVHLGKLSHPLFRETRIPQREASGAQLINS